NPRTQLGDDWMLVRFLIGLIALIGLTAFAPAPMPKPAKKPAVPPLMQQLNGNWRVVSTERTLKSRKLLSRVANTSQRIRIDGKTWSYVYANPDGTERTSTSYQTVFDLAKSPAWLDLKREQIGTVYLKGVISVQGDTAKFCYVLGTR